MTGGSPAGLLAEELITLPSVADLLPNKPHHSTVYRWATKGVTHRNSDVPIKLECVQIGRQRFTSTQAVTRFINTISE